MGESFRFENGQLHCDGVNLEKLFDTLQVEGKDVILGNGQRLRVEVPPTPAFIYSLKGLQRNVAKYKDAIGKARHRCLLGYALKANGNPRLLKEIKESGVEVLVTVSGNEILTGIQAGFDPKRIIFNGNGKQEWEIKLALETGTMLNVDSVFDAENLVKIHQQVGPDNEVCVLLRIRPSSIIHKKGSSVHPYVNTAEESKFGFGVEDLDAVLNVLKQGKNVKVQGIHCHLGSCIYDPSVYKCMGEILTNVVTLLREKGHDVQLLDIGGGIGIDYHRRIPGLEEFLPEDEAGESKAVPYISHFINVIDEALPQGVVLVLEPGRSLIANTSAVICRNLGTKENGRKSFLVVDASMAEVIRPCLYNAHHNIYPTTLVKGKEWKKYDVVGPICETADFLGREILLQPSKYLAIMDTGAYCYSMSSNYNMRPRPAEILISGNSWTSIRKRDEFSSFQ